MDIVCTSYIPGICTIKVYILGGFLYEEARISTPYINFMVFAIKYGTVRYGATFILNAFSLSIASV